MSKLLFVDDFEPFKGKWGVICTPQVCEQGLFVPDGWQEELNLRGITYTERTDLTFKKDSN